LIFLAAALTLLAALLIVILHCSSAGVILMLVRYVGWRRYELWSYLPYFYLFLLSTPKKVGKYF
jgi:fatty-acid desaturase